MKVLFVVNELNFFIRNHINLVKRISEFHEVTLIADASKSNQTDIEQIGKMGIKLHVLNRNKSGGKVFAYLSFIFSLMLLIRKIKPEYIFYVTLELSFFGSLISYFIPTRKTIFIITGLGTFFFKEEVRYKVFDRVLHGSFLLLSALKQDVRFVFLNFPDEELLLKRYQINPSHSQIIHGEGIDRLEFRYFEREVSTIKFLLASRLIKSKGIESFVHSAIQIKQKYPQVKVSIAGIFDPENPDSIHRDLWEEIKSSKDIRWLGEIPHGQMEQYLHEHHVFVLPSEREGLPKAAAEAASTGMPLILSDVPGCQECISDGVTGKLVEYMNHDELYKAMEYFVCNPNQISPMGKQSAKLVEEKLSIEVILDKYLKIIS